MSSNALAHARACRDQRRDHGRSTALAVAVLLLGMLTRLPAAEAAIPSVQTITSAAELNTLLATSTTPVFIDFSAVWCPPCKLLHAEILSAAKDHPGKISFALVDVEQLPDVAAAYNLVGMPLLVLVKGGNPVGRHEGLVKAIDLAAWAGLGGPGVAPPQTPVASTARDPNQVPAGTGAAPFSSATTKLTLTDDQWRQRLSPELYDISRRKSTEPAFCGGYTAIEHNGPGIYHCAACGAPLFISDTKFDSGSGWPSFFKALPGRVDVQEDDSYGMDRTEVHCARCGGHLGHLFNDGPAPTGLRYCINAITLSFEPRVDPPAAKP